MSESSARSVIREVGALAKDGLYLAWEFSVYVILVLLLPLVLAGALVCGIVDWIATTARRRA